MSVYANRLLNFKKMKVIGFDLDHTLVAYNTEAFEGLSFSLATQRLVEKYAYPPIVKKLHFDPLRVIVGLVIDKRNGNVLKLNRFGRVKLAYHGMEEIPYRERTKIYRERIIDLRDPDYKSLDTAFAISNGVLFIQLVQLKKDGAKLPDHHQLASDVDHCIDTLHRDGSLKDIVRANFNHYVVKNPKTAPMIEQLKTFGKKLMIITNSDYAYTQALLDYALNPYWKNFSDWQKVFDLVITFADKPRFFEGVNRSLKIDPVSGSMTNHHSPVSQGIWQGSWYGAIQEGFSVTGSEILYFGDDIYGDVVSTKKRCDWRTALVLNGLEAELKSIRATRKTQARINQLMDDKISLEREVDEADMKRRSGRASLALEGYAQRIEALNTEISELLDKLKNHFNPYWGEILRAGSEESRYAEQMENYACLYMSKVSDLYSYSPRAYFRPPRRYLAHEIAELP